MGYLLGQHNFQRPFLGISMKQKNFFFYASFNYNFCFLPNSGIVLDFSGYFGSQEKVKKIGKP